jgi:energy-coupling factor transporter ATP-binding protein EcfA2
VDDLLTGPADASGACPLPGRLAVVRHDGRQGSGYLLTRRLVLTAAHVVEDAQDVRVTVPGPQGEVRCELAGLWRREQSGIDVALLASDRPLAGDGAGTADGDGGAAWAGNRWARISSLGPVPDCVAVGFPYVQRDAAGRLDTEQLTGTYKPGSGLFSGRDVLALDGVPPAPRPDGVSPLAGMSGAAVFAKGVLMGVVSADPSGWQHGRVTVSPMHQLLDESGFTAVLDAHDVRIPRLTTPPGQLTDEDAEFEFRYATYMAKRHDTLRIFGIDVSGRGRATWPLDAAYYSLEAAPSARRGGGWPDRDPLAGPGEPSGPMPAEEALAGHERVLLRGVAGSGKSTLVQWLAVTTARQEPGERLGHFRDLVPYVLPLRTVARRDTLPAPAEFLSAVDAPMTAPPRWTEQVLTERRGLVLVDGLDEIDERARERVGDWLRGLLAAYPGNHWLVTSRPSAVQDSWLADEGFTELTLSPMSRADVLAFTARWHEAARSGTRDPAELALVDGYERSLLDALHTKQDLARLATNPLMCALICALHRDRGGYLPRGRKELYDAALAMLLVRRDQERELAPALGEAPQIQLLQKLAYWLVKNGQAEMDVADAVGLIGAALPAMPAAAALGDATAVYRHLLARSGLLREPTTATVDFVHRTFQDYLAARAAVEERDFDLMTRNAHHDQWSDVIRMAVAHGRPGERARLLRKIVARGDRTKSHRARLHLLAMACLEHATELDPAVRELVEERGAALIPPRTHAEARDLADVGPLVLELLPGPDGLAKDEARSVVLTALWIGGDPALRVLRRFADHPDTDVRHALALGFPPGLDPRHYAAEILDRLPRPETNYSAYSAEQLDALAGIGGVSRLSTSAQLLPDALDSLGPQPLEGVFVTDPVSDELFRRLARLPGLRELALFDCSALADLSPLAGASLTLLTLCQLTPRLDLARLGELPGLNSLALRSDDPQWPGPFSLPEGLPAVECSIDYGARGLEGVERLTEATHLTAFSETHSLTRRDWDRLRLLPRLTSLTLSSGTAARLDPAFPPLRSIRALMLPRRTADPLPGVLPRLFPAVRRVVLSADAAVALDTLDLNPLAALPELSEVTVRSSGPRVDVIRDALPPEVTVSVSPRPRA